MDEYLSLLSYPQLENLISRWERAARWYDQQRRPCPDPAYLAVISRWQAAMESVDRALDLARARRYWFWCQKISSTWVDQ